MLLLALAALATQDVALPMPNLGDPPVTTTRRFQLRPDGRSLNPDADGCAALLRRVSPGSVSEPLGRAGEQKVKMYLLLDRRIGGCQAPVIVSHDLPDANAARGRNLAEGRATRP